MSTNVVTISKEMYKTHVTQHTFLRSRKSTGVAFVRKECNELLVIRYLTIGVTGSATVTSYFYLKRSENLTS
jgi:hypothetical protein